MLTRARKVWIPIFFSIACVALVAGILGLMNRERPCPLAIQFVRFTNDTTGTHGIFIVTNRSDIALKFRGITETKENGSWPVYPVGTVLPHYPAGRDWPDTGPHAVAPHQSCEVRARMPPDGTPVRVSIACEEPWTAWESRRWSLSVWFHDHSLPRFGEFISKGKPGHLVLSSEIHK